MPDAEFYNNLFRIADENALRTLREITNDPGAWLANLTDPELAKQRDMLCAGLAETACYDVEFDRNILVAFKQLGFTINVFHTVSDRFYHISWKTSPLQFD